MHSHTYSYLYLCITFCLKRSIVASRMLQHLVPVDRLQCYIEVFVHRPCTHTRSYILTYTSIFILCHIYIHTYTHIVVSSFTHKCTIFCTFFPYFIFYAGGESSIVVFPYCLVSNFMSRSKVSIIKEERCCS
jgi:hypothetical protein